jgi:hypothetical protein
LEVTAELLKGIIPAIIYRQVNEKNNATLSNGGQFPDRKSNKNIPS